MFPWFLDFTIAAQKDAHCPAARPAISTRRTTVANGPPQIKDYGIAPGIAVNTVPNLKYGES